MPKVDTHHPDYDRHIADWRMVRDTVDGESAIKAKGAEYLPKTPAQVQHDPGDRRYKAYLTRARFPDLTAPTLRALNGVLHSKDSMIELPPRLKGMIEHATVDGLSILGFARRVTREILMTGRFGILCNSPASNGAVPLLAGYNAETILSWRTRMAGDGKTVVDRVVLDETGLQPDPKDDFNMVEVEKWRVLHLRAGARGGETFQVETYRRATGKVVGDDSGIILDEDAGEASSFGVVMDSIPFVFAGSLDLLPDPDDAMLVPLARLAVSIYQQDADYRATLYQTSQPTAVLIGVDEDDEKAPRSIGSGATWFLPDGADAFFLEVSGAGLGAQRSAILDDFGRAMHLGGKMLESGKSAESGEALRLRRGSETASLTSVALASGMAVQTALRHAAAWVGADPDKVRYLPNLDFIEQYADPAFVRELRESWMSGLLSHDTVLDLLREHEIIPAERTNDEERELIAVQGPLGGFGGDDTMPPEGAGEPQDGEDTVDGG